jgi:hypothetical protein
MASLSPASTRPLCSGSPGRTESHPASASLSPGTRTSFYVYGPQSPAAWCNGSACAQYQGDWVADILTYMREHDKKHIDVVKEEAEVKRSEQVKAIAGHMLLPKAESWQFGCNVLGRCGSRRSFWEAWGRIWGFGRTLSGRRMRGLCGVEFSWEERRGLSWMLRLVD